MKNLLSNLTVEDYIYFYRYNSEWMGKHVLLLGEK